MLTKKARVKIGNVDEQVALSHYDSVAVFDVELPPGPTELQTWLTGRDGTEKGAFFVDVERIQ